MRKLFQRLGFRRPDEMERHIVFRAQRNAYFFLVAALVIWSFYESGQVYLYHTRLNLLPCLLLTGAVTVQSFSQLILTRRAVQDDEDSYETGPFVKIVLFACVLAGFLATAAAALVLMGVRT